MKVKKYSWMEVLELAQRLHDQETERLVPVEHRAAFAAETFHIFENADHFSERYARYVRGLTSSVEAVSFPRFVAWYARVRASEWGIFAESFEKQADQEGG